MHVYSLNSSLSKILQIAFIQLLKLQDKNEKSYNNHENYIKTHIFAVIELDYILSKFYLD